MNILVFGITGMLGSMVYSHLKLNKSFKVLGTYLNKSELGHFKVEDTFQFDASVNVNEQIDVIVKEFNPDYIVNCIGILNRYSNSGNINDTLNAVRVNAVFPALLSNYFLKRNGTKIIQIATDCVFSGRRGHYSESDPHTPDDVYGKTKSLGEISSDNFLNLRCSIIGPELSQYGSLFEWFISNSSNSKIAGYNHHLWNGVTTLQFAQYCEEIIVKGHFSDLRKLNSVIHYTPNETVTKYELLSIINDIFGKNCVISKIDDPDKSVKRDLISEFLSITDKIKMETAILALKEYLDANGIYDTERYIN